MSDLDDLKRRAGITEDDSPYWNVSWQGWGGNGQKSVPDEQGVMAMVKYALKSKAQHITIELAEQRNNGDV